MRRFTILFFTIAIVLSITGPVCAAEYHPGMDAASNPLMPFNLRFDGVALSLYTQDKTPEGCLLSPSAILRALVDFNIQKDSPAYAALMRINSQYGQEFSQQQGTFLFLFEGAGSDPDPQLRYNALLIVVRDGQVIYMNPNCTTLPSFPFEPSYNYNIAVPTLLSGVYDFTTVNHESAVTFCAGLHIVDAQVLRHYSPEDYYLSDSLYINIHRRNYPNSPKDNTVNSLGCLLVGNAGCAPEDEYPRYAAILGITDIGDDGLTGYKHSLEGKVIVDRFFARDYLLAVGYTPEAIDIIIG